MEGDKMKFNMLNNYLDKGWYIFPCVNNEKRPLTENGFKDSSTDLKQIESWESNFPDANWAIETGNRSGVFVVDIDVKNNAQGEESLTELEQQYFLLPQTLTANTASGGRHLYFNCNDLNIRNRTGIRNGIDIRANGGYVLAPPSIVMDKSYTWVDENTEIADAPPWLIDFITSDHNTKEIRNYALTLEGVGQGSRNDSIFKYACVLLNKGTSFQEAQVLVNEAAKNCNPPLASEEAVKCLESAYSRYTPNINYKLTELGNAERFVDMFGEIVRFIPEFNSWVTWTGIHWRFSRLGEIEQLAKRTIRSIYQDAADTKDDSQRDCLIKHAKYSEKQISISNLLKLASNELGISMHASDLNNDDHLFGVNNGTIDLKTGRFIETAREAYITKFGNVEYTLEMLCPKWDKFMNDIMCGEQELVDFLHACIGYTLFGGNSEQIFIILHGNGSNGKSTFLRIVEMLLGNYARSVDNSLFMLGNNASSSGPREDIVRLKDARMILTTETSEGQVLNEVLVKQMTGGDTMTGRVPYAKTSIEFHPKFTPWMAANHEPIIRGDDYAIWRRIMLIPFNRTFTDKERNKNLHYELEHELPGILNKVIAASIDWQKNGLSIPKIVSNATIGYKNDMDLLGEWLEDLCMVGSQYETTISELFASYSEWCFIKHEKLYFTNTTLGRKLKSRGFETTKIKGARGYKGIGFKVKTSNHLKAA
jgi:putative DNA primase/helicase